MTSAVLEAEREELSLSDLEIVLRARDAYLEGLSFAERKELRLRKERILIALIEARKRGQAQ